MYSWEVLGTYFDCLDLEEEEDPLGWFVVFSSAGFHSSSSASSSPSPSSSS